MHEPVLLTEFLGVRKSQMDFAWNDEDDLGPESGHMVLATEAFPYPRFIGGIFGDHSGILGSGNHVVHRVRARNPLSASIAERRQVQAG